MLNQLKIQQMQPRVRWMFSGKRTRAERQKQRRNIVLRDAGVTAKTQQRYFHGLRKMLQFIKTVESALHMDEEIAEWIQFAWDEGEGLYVVSDALCGLHHFEPWTKRMIPMSWRLFSVWRKLEGPDRAPPLTKSIVYSCASYAISHHDLQFGALLCLGFFALLRTGELLQVCPKDILIGKDSAIISLPNTKSGQRDNVAEMVAFDDFMTLELLRAVLQWSKENNLQTVPLWTKSAQSFRERFKYYCKRFDLLSHSFRCYSLRRGGATWLFQATGSMEAALLKGRWSSTRVARIYISDALSYLPGLTFSAEANRMLKLWSPLSM